jgi:hypothetical protein
MADEDLTTKPTLETLLEMMRGIREEVRSGFANSERRLDAIELRLENLEALLDRVTSVAHETRADLRDLKKDLISR